MGKVSLWLLGAAAMALGLYYAAIEAGESYSFARIFFVLSLILFSVFMLTGIAWLYRKTYIRLKPLEILDDIQCTYWTLENHFKVRWHICDQSRKSAFEASYSARFNDGQEVNKAGDFKMDYYCGQSDKDCLMGRKWWLEMYTKDVVVNKPDECHITVTTKPYGRFWLSRQKTKMVKTSVVRHG